MPSPRHLLEYGAFLVFAGWFRLLPHTWARRLGRRLGRAARFVDRRHRRVAEENLAHAFPDLPADERAELLAEAFGQMGLAVADAISSFGFGLEEMCRRLDLVDWHRLERAQERGRGVFILSAHLGLWEAAVFPLGVYGGPLHAVGRPLDNPLLDRWLSRLRERHGNRRIPKRGAVRGMLKVLRAGGRAGILIDQRVQKNEGILVPFFGRPARTTPAVGRLSLATGAPVVPVFAFPAPEGRYRVEVGHPIWPGETAAAGLEGDAAVEWLTRRYSAVTEAAIRRRPASWMWGHRRWRLD